MMFKIIYIIIAVITFFLVVNLTILIYAHADGKVLFAVPVVGGLLLLPLLIQKIKDLPNIIKIVSYFIPFVVIVSPVLFFLLFQPQYQKLRYIFLLNKIKVESIQEQPITTPQGVVIGSSIKYTLRVPKPIDFPSYDSGASAVGLPEFSAKNENGLLILSGKSDKISTNSVQDLAFLYHSFPEHIQGAYDFTLDEVLMAGIKRDKNQQLCSLNLVLKSYKDLKKIGDFQPNIQLESTVHLPLRAGILRHVYLSQPSTIKMNGAEIMKYVEGLPQCPPGSFSYYTPSN